MRGRNLISGRSRFGAIPALYFYDSEIVDIARNLKLSTPGEIEISDINRHYLAVGRLQVDILPAEPPGSTQTPSIPYSKPPITYEQSSTARVSK